MAAVSVEAVSKRYRDFEAISDLSVEIPAHRLIALIGHNGAGKTTLLKMILGITRPRAGDIRLWGAAVRTGETQARQIGFLPEVFNFNDAMTGLEALTFLARLKNQSAGQCAELLQLVGLTDAAGRRIKVYSKGMRQRLGLAQALLGNPRLLVLDEPTTGLDPDLRRDFYRIVSERRRAGATVIVSTHSLHEIETHADQVVVLRKGCLAANGTVPQLCEGLGIPTRIEAEFSSSAARQGLEERLSGYEFSQSGERQLRIDCAGANKLELLQTLLSDAAGLSNIHIHAPRLDDVYRHYMDEDPS